MEGWGKGLDKPSVPCLSEFLLNFEGGSVISFFFSFLSLKHFVSRHGEKKCDYVLFFFCCVIPTAVYYSGVFI